MALSIGLWSWFKVRHISSTFVGTCSDTAKHVECFGPVRKVTERWGHNEDLLSSKVVDSCPINSSRRKIIALNFIGNSAGTSKSVHTTSSVGEPDHNGIVLKYKDEITRHRTKMSKFMEFK